MKYYNSKKKILRAWLICAMFIGMGSLIFVIPDSGSAFRDLVDKCIAWVTICFFGSTLILLTLQAFRSGEQLEINDQGIIDYRTSLGLIQWDDIKELWVKAYTARSIETARVLCVELKNPETYIAKLPARARVIIKTFGYRPIVLSLSTLNSSFDEIVGYIKSKHPEKFK
jgi:hypothetical protein